MLEQAGIRALEHRATDHQAIGMLDRFDEVARALVEPAAAERGDAMAGIDEVEDIGLERVLCQEISRNGFNKHARLGRAPTAAAEANDAGSVHADLPRAQPVTPNTVHFAPGPGRPSSARPHSSTIWSAIRMCWVPEWMSR